MKRFFALLTMLSFVFVLFGQERTITGTVTDADSGEPLPGVSIVLQGTSTGVITDLDGNFSINASEGQVLVFSFVGYLNEEVTIAGQSTVDVNLVTDIQSLDEVVVIGYGTQKKSLVTGAISKLGSDEIVNTQPTRVEQAIQGKVSGVSVSQNSGSPGGGLTIRIRGISTNGNSDPLYIVDGMKTGGIDYLDPADIESIEILKDAASAAIYGAEGGNGVVLITTKKGTAGATQVSYNAYYGQQYYVDRLDVLNQSQYLDYYHKAFEYEANWFGYERGWNQDQINNRAISQMNDADLPLPGEPLPDNKNNDTDWINELTSPAPVMSHNLSISGGNEKTTYSSSANYYDQEGITGGDKARFQRFTARLNMETQATDWFKFGVKATYSYRKRAALAENSEFGGVYGNAIMLDPLTPKVYANGNDIEPTYLNSGFVDAFVRDDANMYYGMSTLVKNEIVNPLAQIQVAQGSYKEDKVLAGAFAEITFMKGLKFKTSYDVDIANAFDEGWTPVVFYHDLRKTENSSSYQNQNRYQRWFFDNILSYNNTFGKHSVSAMVGVHAEEFTWNQMGIFGKNLIKEQYSFTHPANAVFDTIIQPNEVVRGFRADPERIASVFGRLSYNYAEKYMLNATIRNDRSSKLSPKENPETGRPYNSGIFPSVSVGWVFSKEDFWPLAWWNFAKVRYSYGENGSLSSIGAFQYVSLIQFQGYPYYDANNNTVQGAGPSQLSNDALQWESTNMHNIGLDFRMFNSKLSGSVEYFKKTTDDLLMPLDVPGYVGNNAPDGNVGQVVNDGIEIELSYKDFDGDFQWEVGGNISFLNNTVKKFPGGAGGTSVGIGDGQLTRIDEDLPIWYFYGFKTDGVWKDAEDIETNNYYTDDNGDLQEIQANVQPGDVKIVNTDTNPQINNEDKVQIGSPHADVLFGLNFSAYYKGLDFAMNITGSIGNDVYFGVYRNDIGLANRAVHFYEDAWSPENPNADFFRPTTSSTWNFRNHDMFVQNGSYVKLRNVQIGYTLPSSITDRMNINKLRFYVSGNNLLILTKYKGADPEMGDGGSSIGVDRGFYAPPRQFLAGVNVTF